jgi:DNA modification methylase
MTEPAEQLRKSVGTKRHRERSPEKSGPPLHLIRGELDLSKYVPDEVGEIRHHQTDLPRIAKDPKLTNLIEKALRDVPTKHDFFLHDARKMDFLQPESVHLVVTSPPYWTLKEYRPSESQMGYIADYEEFLDELDKVWGWCQRALIPGGRLIIVVGDVCLSRRKNNGRHTVVPLHASIQERCRKQGFDNVQGIIWQKIANASYEVENGSSFLGKPYEPNAVIKNDVEYILMQRKPGGYRSPSLSTRIMSVISSENYQRWFRVVWEGVTGASTKKHPAPYPADLAERLIRMFSFAGDTVLDPFMGTGSTTVAAARCGRNSIGVEVDPHYYKMALDRIAGETRNLFSAVTLNKRKPDEETD